MRFRFSTLRSIPWTPIVSCAVMFFLLLGCGADTDFAGAVDQDDAEATPAPTPEPTPFPPPDDPGEIPVDPYASLNWYWYCQTDGVTPPDPVTDLDVVVSDTGPHPLERERLKDTPVTFSGSLCPPQSLLRDIVFVIDVSGSMDNNTQNDPRVGDRCARLDAVEQVLSMIGDDVANFGIVTFSSQSPESGNSTGLFSTRSDLLADITRGGQSVADVLCAADGNTNYTSALMAARGLLEQGEVDRTKEVYFISDGDPTGLFNGIAQASQMRYPGVDVAGQKIPATIATLMLRGNDAVMEAYIASRIPDGTGGFKPLHAKVEHSTDLAEALATLANNEIVSAVLRHRPVGGTWTEVSILDHIDTSGGPDSFDFELPSFTIDIEEALNGVEVEIEYRDTHDNVFLSSGRLVWVQGDPNSGGGGADPSGGGGGVRP